MAPPVPQRRSPIAIALAATAAALILATCFHRQVPNIRSFIGGRPCQASQRQLGVGRKAVDIALKQRIVSVKKTGKVTDAMRLVAAAKVRRAQEGVEKSRPFSNELVSMIKGIVKKLKGTGLEAELPMLKVPEKVNNVAILTIMSNRGLCGPYNSFLSKKVRARVEQLNAQGISPVIVPIGKKALKLIPRRCDGLDYNMSESFFDMPDKFGSKMASEVGDVLRNMFLSGEVDKVEIIFAKFFNLLKNDPTTRTLLPLSPTGIEDPEDETFKLTSVEGKLSVEKEKVEKTKAKEIEPDVIFDQPPDVILNSMLPLYLNSQILALLWEAQASELGSRMTAMKAATDNAKELAKNLEMIYNKKRQAAITQEICEISAGAMAIDEMNEGSINDLGAMDSEESITDEFMEELESGSVPDKLLSPEDIYASDEVREEMESFKWEEA
jgi:F-type H+-transporting ATPase subunit gamma